MNLIELVATITDTDLQYTPKGTAVLNIGLAGETHQENKRTKFYISRYNCVAFGKQAADAVNSIGKHVHALGRLDFQEWQDQKTGDKRSKLGIILDTIKPLSHQEARGLSAPDARGVSVISPAHHRVLLAGNLTRDPVIRDTRNGSVLTSMGMAVDVGSRLVDGQWVGNPPVFVDLTAWGDLSAEGLVKGQPVVVKGRFNARSWEQDGVKRFAQGVVVDSILPLERYFAAPAPAAASRAPAAPQSQRSAAPVSPGLDIDDEFPPEEGLPF